MTIYNSLNKMNGLFNSKEDVNFTLWNGKNNSHNFKPKEHVYSMTLHFKNPRYLTEDQILKESAKQQWQNKTNFLNDQQIKYFQKASRFSPKSSLSITYDLMMGSKYKALEYKEAGRWHEAGNLRAIRDVPDDNIRVNPDKFNNLQERYNKTFIISKHSINNYYLNLDKLLFTKDTKPSLLQRLMLNHL